MDDNTLSAIESGSAIGAITVIAVMALVFDGSIGEMAIAVACAGLGAYARHIWPTKG